MSCQIVKVLPQSEPIFRGVPALVLLCGVVLEDWHLGHTSPPGGVWSDLSREMEGRSPITFRFNPEQEKLIRNRARNESVTVSKILF